MDCLHVALILSTWRAPLWKNVKLSGPIFTQESSWSGWLQTILVGLQFWHHLIYVEPIPWLTFIRFPGEVVVKSFPWAPPLLPVQRRRNLRSPLMDSWSIAKGIVKAGDSQAWNQYSHLGWLGCWPIGSQHDQVDEEPSPFRLRCEAFCGSSETMIGWCHGLGALLGPAPQRSPKQQPG